MNRKIKYTNEPLGKTKIARDFLPSPDELSFREENVKVTMLLSKSSVGFFKTAAKKRGTRYQTMIRSLLDSYAARYR